MKASLQQNGGVSASNPKQHLTLAPNERRAPIGHLSPKDHWALLACFNNGGLQKQDGSWRGKPGDKPINGNTVANLSREGLLAVTKDKKSGSAQLTERGAWFARTLLS